jgi:hypothetical protein
MSSTIENLFHDFLAHLIERAMEAKDRSKGVGIGAENKDFEDGRALAYYEVVSSFINRALAFGLTPDSFPALKFDADKELLS